MPVRRQAYPVFRPACRGSRGILAAAPSRANRRLSNGPIISGSASPTSPRLIFRSGTARCQTNKKVAFLMPNDADGNALRTIFKPILEKAGFTVIDPGGYEDGTTDYSAQIGNSRTRIARSSPLARFRRTSRCSGARRRSRATPVWSRSPRSRRPACSRRKSKRWARSDPSSPPSRSGIRRSRTNHR